MVYKEQYLINEIRKYIQNENEMIQFIDDFRKEPYHFKEAFYHAIINKKTIVLCMHGSKEEIQLPYITAYLKGNRTINKVKKWMHLFQIHCIYVIVTLQKGRIAQQMREQLENEIIIHFTIDEELCHRLCITYPKDTIIITHAKKEDQLFQTLSKYFPCYELGEEIQTSKKEVVVVPMLLQSGTKISSRLCFQFFGVNIQN